MCVCVCVDQAAQKGLAASLVHSSLSFNCLWFHKTAVRTSAHQHASCTSPTRPSATKAHCVVPDHSLAGVH